MNQLQSKLKELEQMLIDDGYNGSNIVIQTLEEIREEAINYTHCCTELKGKYKMSFNDWLRVNCEPTRNKNLFIKNKKLQTRLELIGMYEKE